MIILVIVSAKCNPNFVDSEGENCQDYIDSNYCTSSGSYGPGWIDDWGIFGDYATNGQTAFICPQCGCSNGKRIWYLYQILVIDIVTSAS